MRLAAAAVALALAAPVTPRAAAETPPATPAPAPRPDAAPPAATPAPKADAAPGAAAPRKPPPAAARELAKALLTSEQWDEILDGYAGSLATQVSQSLGASGEPVPQDLRGRFRSALAGTLPYQQTVDAQAEALADRLTPDELSRTAAFYGTPLGRKVLDRLPEAQSAAAKELQSRLATAVPGIVERIAPRALAPSTGAEKAAPPAAQGRKPPAPEGGSRR